LLKASFGSSRMAEVFERELMKMKNAGLRRAVVLILLVAASGVCAPFVRGQEASRPAAGGGELKAVVYEGDMAALLQHLAKAYEVTIGFEAAAGQPRPQAKVNVREATLRDVLDAIVRSRPEYRWRQDGSFVDVYPAAGGSPLLDTVVGSFRLSASRWAEAADALLSLPEVQSRASAMSLTRREAEGGAAGGGGEVFSLRLENVPVRAALHEMTRRSGGHFWVFRQYGDGGKSFSLGTAYR
jgi:hypothetical protein